MFRIADGEELGYDDPPSRGHSIEFRINAEDPGRRFLPAPGTITTWRSPSRAGGADGRRRIPAGMTVPQAFDSLLAKLIVTGASRAQALERSRRALAEFQIGGMPTVLPFHRAVVDDPAFTSEPFSVHTRWIETEFAGNLPPYSGERAHADAPERERITVEVGGKRLEVVLPAALAGLAGQAGGAGRQRGVPAAAPPRPGSAARQPRAPRRPGDQGGGGPGGGSSGGTDTDALVCPMQGTIVKIVAADGTRVSAGDTVVVLEAMKMEQPLTAHKDGTVTGLAVRVGQTVPAGEVICELRG